MIQIDIDLPENCNDCPCAYFTEGVSFDCCQATGKPLEGDWKSFFDKNYGLYSRPEWCPLKSVESIPGDATNSDALNIMMLQTFPKVRFSRVVDELNKTQKIVMSEEWLDHPYKEQRKGEE